MALDNNQELEKMVNLKNPESVKLPDRIARLSNVSWHPCWIQQLKTEGKSFNTIKSYSYAVRKFIDTKISTNDKKLENEKLENLTVNKLYTHINPKNGRLDIWLQSINNLKSSTVNARLAAITHLIEWVGHNLPEYIIRPRKGKHIPKILSNNELKKVRIAAFNSENPIAHLIVTFLLETGIRISELCGLNVHDVDFADKSARVVGGKGNKDRMVLYTEQTAEILTGWIIFRKQLNLVDSDALLVNSKGKRITPRGIQKLMDKIAENAGISKNRLSPHILRHNFATGLLERGADIVSIQRLLGHSNIQTTRVYLEINDQTLREVYSRAQSNLERINE
ncbi:MAG: hypothetical protein CMB56_005085 [Methanobacteriota archaeon]|nr:MAG: hypothetical protein CMB56_005085 [Euryarchaeota archaeon]|tara:strand:- start:2855 stop:3865 length:1011 start_codon:yes stop_codon:yes gene_type:complete